MPRSRESTVQEMQRDGIADARRNATPSENLSRDLYRFEDVEPLRLIGGGNGDGRYARLQMVEKHPVEYQLHKMYQDFVRVGKASEATQAMRDAHNLYNQYRKNFRPEENRRTNELITKRVQENIDQTNEAANQAIGIKPKEWMRQGREACSSQKAEKKDEEWTEEEWTEEETNDLWDALNENEE